MYAIRSYYAFTTLVTRLMLTTWSMNWVSRSLDTSIRHPDRAERQKHQAVIDLLTPVVKA